MGSTPADLLLTNGDQGEEKGEGDTVSERKDEDPEEPWRGLVGAVVAAGRSVVS